MAPNNDPDRRPTPDPTVLTTEALERGLRAERDYVNGEVKVLRETLNRIDRAAEVLHETVTRVPTDVQLAVSHLADVMHVELRAIQTQFKERDTRSERESKDNKVAVDAAFAAQKEAAAKQDEGNARAIDKSEKTTVDTIKALGVTVSDLKDRIGKIESVKVGATEVTTSQRAAVSDQRADATGYKQSLSVIIAAASVLTAVIFGVSGVVITLLLQR